MRKSDRADAHSEAMKPSGNTSQTVARHWFLKAKRFRLVALEEARTRADGGGGGDGGGGRPGNRNPWPVFHVGPI